MSDYELSRRDAIAALTTSGIAVAAGGVLTWDYLDDGDEASEGSKESFTKAERETLLALAETVYPSAVDGIPEFVETYVVGRVDDDPDRLSAMEEAIDYLEEYTTEQRDKQFRDLPVAERTEVLELMGVDVVDPDPDPEGLPVGRVRFYLVNELLYALYTSPTGGELVGIENPQGHPGGTESYRRGPQ